MSDPIKKSMSVYEFNTTIAYRPLKLPLDMEVKVINDTDPTEILIEVNGRKAWRAKRKHVRSSPKVPHIKKVAAVSNIPQLLLNLSPQEFKLYYWIKSLSVTTFPMTKAAKDTRVAIKTVRDCVEGLERSGLIKIVARTLNVGYTIEVLK